MPAAAVAALIAAVALLAGAAPRAASAGRAPAPAAVAADSIAYRVAISNVNRVGLTVSNYGFLGNNFSSRTASFEFPLGSGFEHMSRAGLWVGAKAISDTGVFTGVSVGIVDDNQGTNALSGTEFTPAGNAITIRSRIPNSAQYSKKAISDQDLICSYSDEPGRGPQGFLTEPHHPLDIVVEQRVLGFSLPAAQDFEVVRFNVINHGPPLRDVYVGLFVQLAIGDKGHSPGWPPSAWYYKVYGEYDAARRMYRAHYCESVPYPDACAFDKVPPWSAVKLLGVHPDSIAAKTVSFNWWSHTLGDTTLDEDTERYARMSDGLTMDPRNCHAGAQQCSPISLLSVGPFAQIDPGDTVTVDFALIGGDDEAALFRNADFAQFASDIDYRLPAPPPSPRLHVAAGANRVDFYWDDSPENTPDETSPAPNHLDFEGYRLYLGTDRQHPLFVAQFDRATAPGDTVGFNTGFAAIRRDTVIAGVPYRYHYAVTGLHDGFSYFGAVTSYDLGDTRVASLESGLSQNKFQVVPSPAPGEGQGVTVFPNPYRVEAAWDRGAQVRDHYLWFARLPERCMLRIYTLGGDRVFETRFDGASYHGESARGLFNPVSDLDTGAPALSGASYAWNMITSEGQAIATGLYIFSVEDLDTGRISRGKFLVVKSDREGR
jgi:hypothetical protein